MEHRWQHWRADWGEPPWRVDLTFPAARPPDACDVAVVGGGFTGLAAAYHLARRGMRVAVLEAARIGDGASGRTGGLALEGTARGPLPGVEHCLDELRELSAAAAIDCDLHLGECWEVEHGARRSDRPAWRDGEQWLRIAQIVAGGTLDPAKLVAGLARAALAAGAAICERAAVLAVDDDGDGVRLSVGGASVRAGHAVIALNAYTAELLALPVSLHAPLTMAVCTAPVDAAAAQALGLAQHTPFYTVDLPYLWGRWAPGNRLIVGAGLAAAPDGVVRHVDIQAAESAAIFSRLEARTRGLHPALADIAITHRWGGPIAFRNQAVPMLGRPADRPRVIVTGAYAGHGVALSVRIGRLVADAITDGAPLPDWGAI